jgi:hypothetical protein
MFNPGYPNEIVEGARRVAHQSKFKREHDNNAINGMIERAEAIAEAINAQIAPRPECRRSR